MNVQICKSTPFCRSKCIYQFAIASSATRQKRNLRELHFIAMRLYIFLVFFSKLNSFSLDSQVPRPALNNLAPSFPQFLAFWVGNFTFSTVESFRSVCKPRIPLFSDIGAV